MCCRRLRHGGCFERGRSRQSGRNMFALFDRNRSRSQWWRYRSCEGRPFVCINFQGSETHLIRLQNLPSNAPLASSTRASLHSFLTHFFPTLDRISCVESTSEGSTVIRSLCEKSPKGVRWREARARILAERVEWEVNDGETDLGTMRIEGVVRGARLSADRLVHLQGYGDFMIEKVSSSSV